MVVQEHLAWPRITGDLQSVDEMLTKYLNNIPPLEREWFSADEIAIIGRQALGHTREQMQGDFPELNRREFHQLHAGIYDKMGVEQDKDAVVAYRACASNLIKYDIREWDGSESLTKYAAIVYKARAAGYSISETGKLLPGSGGRAVNNARYKINVFFDAENAVHAIVRGFEDGLFARDV